MSPPSGELGPAPLDATIHLAFAFDVGYEIDLSRARGLLPGESGPLARRRRTPESIQSRLEAIAGEFDGAESVKRLQLIQEQLDLEAELATLTDGPGGMSDEDFAVLEQAFIKDAKLYSNSKGIAYSAWRTFGVPRPVLRAAGITRK